MNSEDIKNYFKKVQKERRDIVYCLETILASNCCKKALDNTQEANIANLITFSLFSRAIINLRKILEPGAKDKVSNLSNIIKFIDNNKELLAEEHYQRTLSIEAININLDEGDECHDDISFSKGIQKRDAELDKQKCLDSINLLQKRWELLWRLLSDSESFRFLRDNRDYLVHSFSPTKVTYTSVNKIYKLYNVALWFIKKIDFILNNSSFNYKIEERQIKELAERFWTRIN